MSRIVAGVLASVAGLLASCSDGDGACGDGKRDGGEACDTGAANSDVNPGACRKDCTLARCGDGVADAGEECDDGAANGTRGACREGCVAPRCGDGLTDPGEECDWGAANDDTRPENCRTTCRRPHCGDGVRVEPELCDDGAANSDVTADACRTDCRPPSCGDGTRDAGEACDDGARNDRFAADACRPDCALPACGDSVIDTGEECDDGDRAGHDGCDTFCRYALPATCGAPELPLADLREVGTPDGQGFVVSGSLPAGIGVLAPGTCGGAGAEALYAFPIPTFGDLVVELEAASPSLAPVLVVRQACPGNERACVAGEAGGGPVRLVLPEVGPSIGAIYLQVDSADATGGDFALRVHLRPPLVAGDACTTDGSEGRCDPLGGTLACADPDGDGRGTCVPWVGAGGACDPEGADSLCREPNVCVGGMCIPSCGDGVPQPWEECDDGNAAEDDFCSSTCELPAGDCASPVPVDAIWDSAAGTAAWADDTGRLERPLTGTCGGSASGLVGRFVAPEAGRYEFALDAGFAYPTMSLLGACDSADEELACLNGSGVKELDLAAAQAVFAIVASRDPAQVGPFTVSIAAVACGDGIRRGGEECDDGNHEAGDGCNPDCTLQGESCADPYPLPSPDAAGATGWAERFAAFGPDHGASCSASTRADAVAAFVAPAAGRYSFEVRGTGAVVVSVVTGGCVDGTVRGCVESPGAVAPAAVEAALEAGETAWVLVHQRYSTGEFSLTVAPLLCGDGRRTRPEECDDGNLAAGDGCDPACRVEAVAEVEPNDVRARAQPLAVGETFAGGLSPGDLDHVSVELAAGTEYTFETYVGGWERCSGGGALLRLHGPAGEHLLEGASSGLGSCTRISFVPPAAGRYFLRAEPIGSGGAPFDYLLRTGTVAP